MGKEGKNEIQQSDLRHKIKSIAQEFLSKIKDREIHIISHFDTDGITSAAIIINTLKRLDKRFNITIVKNLSPNTISQLPEDKTLLFLDLASNSLNYLKERNQDIFIIDHHEITQEIPENISIINPQLHKQEEISSAGLCYLFSKSIDIQNKDLASLGVVGMIGDMIDNINSDNNEITQDADIKIRKGLLLYPSTRPLNRVLEFSSEPYIPSVTGNREGVLELLREIGLERENGKYKSLIELDEEEMTKIVSAVLVRRANQNHDDDIIGNIFLVKHFNQLEDARELSAKINATSRLGESYTAILYCMGNQKAKKEVEKIYARYKQLIINALNNMEKLEKIQGEGYLIINAKRQIKDTIIGTITSILSKSSLYKKGTIITGMSYTDEGDIKVSVRLAGRNGRNLREILQNIVPELGGEFGGHHSAAGCTIPAEKEKEFIDKLKRHVEIELVKL